ncbi:Nucleolar protein 12 [Lambiella insularis]|nr:Nucleolar protein 12 [Lambiella insularis]
MGKRPKQTSSAGEDPNSNGKKLSAISNAVDPALAALFQSSLKQKPKRASQVLSGKTSKGSTKSPFELASSTTPSNLSQATEKDQDNAEGQAFTYSNHSMFETNNVHEKMSSRKRQRTDVEDDIEGKYMQRLAQEEEHEAKKDVQERNGKRVKLQEGNDEGIGDVNKRNENGKQDKSFPSPPQHETLTPKSTPDHSLEQATRTVFLANVSTTTITSKTAYNTFLAHLSSHLPSLPNSTLPHKISSFRFRSTPYADSSLPKKAAFAKKDVMDATTKSTNAYAVYSTPLAAREAVKRLNGIVVLGRHLRVDGVAHPSATDHRRCVFVGNLGFVDDESAIRAAEDEASGKTKARKQKQPADVEEGLWQQFNKAGAVESVRVVRDKTTRVGKGFAYVQFKDSNAVERALLYNDHSYPPLLPRKLRVTRAKNIAKTASHSSKPTSASARNPISGSEETYTPKPSSQRQSLSGRAGKLLGRAGAAKIRRTGITGTGATSGGIKTPERIIFEGYRARSGQKPTGLQARKKGGKPGTRSSKRGAAFKASGGKKKRT